MSYIINFLAGLFLCNCIPHLVSGVQGSPFPTPFAKPRGIGDSSPLVNFLWGFLNLLVGLVLLSIHPVSVGFNFHFTLLMAGALAIGAFSASHFGNVLADRLKSEPPSHGDTEKN